MVNSFDEWLCSSWHCMLGNIDSPARLSTDALQHQIFLGDETFVSRNRVTDKNQKIYNAYCFGGYT